MVDGFRDWAARMSNWGRWGDGDQIGTVNLLTDSARASALASVRDGIAIPLALDLNAQGPQPPESSRINAVHVMRRTGESEPEPGGFHYMDDLVMLHTHASTQLDALSHVAYDGQLYNGHPVSTVSDAGAAVLGIETLRGGIVGRGVLVDLPRFLGLEILPAEHIITPTDLEACLAAQSVAVQPGDCLLFRTGWISLFTRDGDRAAYLEREPGIGVEAALWVKEHDIAFVASDNWAVEVVPGEFAGESMPVHCLLIRDAGMPLGEMFDLGYHFKGVDTIFKRVFGRA